MSKLKLLFGRKIKEYRKKKCLTKAQLAEMVDIDDKHISCIENGKNFPSADLLERISNALNIEPKDLFEFYYLQDIKDLKSDIISMVNKLSQNDLSLVHKYIRNFIIK